MSRVFCCSVSLDLPQETIVVLEAHVSQERVQASRRKIRPEDRIRSLFAELLAAYALGQVYGLHRSALRFVRDEYGKPILSGRDDVHFSLTHTDNWVGCAVADHPIGIDIERKREHFPDVTGSLFAPAECEYVSRAPDNASRSERFYRIWSAKESYVKAAGKGLASGLRSFSSCGADGIGDVTGAGGEPTGYIVHQTSLDDKHFCSVCAHSASGRPDYAYLQSQDVLAQVG
jgi:4'-phosphopantetheinyl transferase